MVSVKPYSLKFLHIDSIKYHATVVSNFTSHITVISHLKTVAPESNYRERQIREALSINQTG